MSKKFLCKIRFNQIIRKNHRVGRLETSLLMVLQGEKREKTQGGNSIDTFLFRRFFPLPPITAGYEPTKLA